MFINFIAFLLFFSTALSGFFSRIPPKEAIIPTFDQNTATATTSISQISPSIDKNDKKEKNILNNSEITNTQILNKKSSQQPKSWGNAFEANIKSAPNANSNLTSPVIVSNITGLGTATANLSTQEILQGTNVQRTQIGLNALSINQQLNNAATARLNDMIANNYFSHTSPTGVSFIDAIKANSYKYSMVAENIAVGDFENSQGLITAWMNSQGHRENILNPIYSEIGIAVGKGYYQGRMTWFAVQEFGSPQNSL